MIYMFYVHFIGNVFMQISFNVFDRRTSIWYLSQNTIGLNDNFTKANIQVLKCKIILKDFVQSIHFLFYQCRSLSLRKDTHCTNNGT